MSLKGYLSLTPLAVLSLLWLSVCLADNQKLSFFTVSANSTSSTTVPPSNGKSGTTVPPSNGKSGTTVPPSNGKSGTTVPPNNGKSGTTVPPNNSKSGTTVPPRNGTSSAFVKVNSPAPTSRAKSNNLLDNNSPMWDGLIGCRKEHEGHNAKTPVLLMECISDRFLVLLGKTKSNDSLKRELNSRGLEVADKYFDFTRMTALAFGRNWMKLSLEEKRRLVQEFRTVLFDNYSDGLSRFLGYKSSVVSSDTSDIQSIVHTIVSDGHPDHVTKVDYYLLRVNGDWMIYDVSVSGISLISSYRQQLEATYGSEGMDGVFEFLRQINKENKDNVVS
ncbi:Tgt2/MlaC family protein [Candidatus Ichthyocystis sparus]|uniref:Tgt2/MlaC family protein n=1 Tax=Candidatus Ichthyocystis sparus TaxID=1561004 RepID=UPI000B826368|nr:ABC transporter substrate-binding protein [Candidatus Ichthyocystis sparus]